MRWLMGSIVSIAPGVAAAQSLLTPPISGPPGSPAAASAAPAPPSAPEDPETALQSADIPQTARDMAAIRLIAWRDPAARPKVVDFLTNGSTPTKVAVSRALASVRWADPDFVQPLVFLLRSRDPVPAAAAALALGIYQDDAQVLQELILQAKSDRTDIRQPVIRALGAFSRKDAAQTLLSLLEHDDSPPIREAAGNALVEMTGRSDLDHDSSRWAQWWQQNGALPDDQFRAAIIRGRGEAFEKLVADHRALQNDADDFLRSDFWNAAPEKRAAILLSYLQSSAPEIRALGAELVFSSATETGAAPAGTIQQTRLLLGDPSAEVRAAAAAALSADVNSAADLVAQLAREPDDFVRVRLITSLAPFHDVHAIQQMLTLVGPGPSNSVRIAAADGIGEGSDIINSNQATKDQAIKALENALDGTDAPDQQRLREAIVGALASIHDDSLSNLFRHLLSQDESLGVRAHALVGLGNLPHSAPFAGEIDRHLDDEDVQMRLAAIQALRRPPSPIPISYITKLLSLMTGDGNDQVRAAAWDELQYWAQLPDMDEAGLSTLADGLKSQPANELLIRQKLCDRLAQDVKKGRDTPQGRSAAKELAEEQQTVGDLMMKPPINTPLQAADQYRAALDFWKSNDGGVDVINRLSGDITDALLAARHWDEAAVFASGIVKQYGKNPDLMVTSQTVGREFVVAVRNLEESSDPSSYGDAIALLDATQKMDPPLPPDFPEELAGQRSAIEAKHAASSKPSP
jgi:HEAT repeat protein